MGSSRSDHTINSTQTMKLVILFALVAVAAAAKLPVAIVRQSMVTNEDGSFSSGYESADGKREVVTGFNKQIDAENKGMSMRGTYSWVEAGVTYTVNWVADENGFQPEGAHLPVAPVA